MRNKKGFTLIELLAILSILGVILLITMPLILDIIENSRKHAFVNSSLLITKAAEEVIVKSFGDENSIDISDLKDSVFFSDNYEGKIIYQKKNDAIEYYVTITDTKYNYSFCGILREEIDVKKIQSNNCNDYFTYLTHTTNPDQDTWVKDNVDINLIVNDKYGIGFEYIEFPNTNRITNIDDLTSYQVNNNGTYTFIIKNYNDHEIGYNVVIKNIDKIPPEIEVAHSYNNNVAKLTISATDTESGVDKIILPNGDEVIGNSASFETPLNGSYVFKAIDNVGNERTETIIIEKLDNTPPSLILTPTPTTWTNGDVTINATSNDEDLDYIMFEDGTKGTSFIVNSNGEYSFTAYDEFGNSSTKSITIANIDKVAPGINHSVNITDWTKNNVVINVTVSDFESGINYIETPTGTKIYNTTTTFSATTNGTYIFKVYDKAGNVTTRNVVVSNIDKTLPTGTISYSTTAWTKNNVVVTATCSDSQSGVVNSTVTKTVSANGTGTVACTDKVGNVSNISYNVTNIDKTLPTGTISYSTTAWTNQNIVVTATCSDSQSGVVSSKVTKTVSANGTGTVACTDKVGNVSNISYNVSNIDKTLPTGTISYSTTAWTNQNIVVTATCSDSQSGIVSSKVTKTVSANGTGTVACTDKVGNVNNISYNVTNIDKIPPTFVLTYYSTGGSYGSFKITASDTGGSGVNKITHNGTTINNGSTTNLLGRYNNYEVTDKAGNKYNSDGFNWMFEKNKMVRPSIMTGTHDLYDTSTYATCAASFPWRCSASYVKNRPIKVYLLDSEVASCDVDIVCNGDDGNGCTSGYDRAFCSGICYVRQLSTTLYDIYCNP